MEPNQDWNCWKFQIHWNKLEWVNPRSRNERKNPFLFLKTIISKDNVKTTHWVSHLHLRPINTNDLF